MTFKTVLNDLGQKFNSSSSNNNIFLGKPFYCKWVRVEVDPMPVKYLTHTKDSMNGQNNPPIGQGPVSDKYLTHTNCCFNHIIGLPSKGNTVRPLYRWQEKYLFEPLERYRYNWIKKSTGIGVSEFVLRYLLWRSLVNNEWSNGIVPILTGPNIDLSKRLIARAYEMISEFLPNSKINDYKLMVNNVEIAAFPGKNVDSARSLTNVRLTLLEEADFFSKGEQEDARKIAERYIGKSKARILMISTPNSPGGLFETIENEDPCMYNRILLPYTLGLDNIFSQKEIAEAKRSKSFEQEYNLKYLGGVGNLFPINEIENCIEEEYDIIAKGSRYFTSYMGIDPGYGSSKFAIVVVIWRNDKLEVVETHNISNILYTDSLRLIDEIILRWGLCKIYVDASGSHLIKQLCDTYQQGSYKHYELLSSEQLKRFRHSSCRSPLICPVPFSTEHRELMKNTQECISFKSIRIHPQFEELITALKSAQSKEGDQYSLDKSKSANNDLLDALRLALESVNK